MDDKKALLGELKIDDSQREAPSSSARWIVTGVGTVVLAAAAWFWLKPGQEPVSVAVATARTASIETVTDSSAVLDATGYVTARRKATVSSKITGKVREVFIEEGLKVEADQLLATLDDSTQRANFNLTVAQLQASMSRLHEVDVLRQEAVLNLNRTVELEQKNLASTADLDRDRLALEALEARLAGLEKDVEVAKGALQVQQQQLDDMQIRAPFAGVVIAKAAQPGEMISPVSAGGGFTRTGICTIVDMDSLEIEVDVNEAYINRVQPGQKVNAMLNSYPDWKIPSEVITIIPTADRSKATVRVRIRFLSRDDRILPDMGVRVAFLQEMEPQQETKQMTGVLIPTNAVINIDGENTVFVVSDNRVTSKTVKLGEKIGGQRNVTSGLTAGQKLVTGLDDELVAQLSDDAPVTVQ